MQINDGSMKLSQKIALGYVSRKLQMLSAVSTKKAAEKAFQLFCTPQKRVPRKSSVVIDKATIVEVMLNGLKIYGYRWGASTNKRILIVHGFESSAINFEAFVEPLVNKGYEVLAFDAPAHGISEGNQIILPLYRDMISAVNDKYGPFTAYIAHSLGGLALTHFLKENPHTPDTKLVLIAPATEITSIIDRFFRLLKLNHKVRVAFDRISEQVTGISPANASILHTLNNIQSNILWLHDTEDDITPYRDVERIKQPDFPNIKFIITSGLGHRKIYRSENSLKAIIDFV